jgi:hypothetical protein
MPIQFAVFDISPICTGHNWIELDEDRLASLVANLLLGRFRHVVSVINGNEVTAPATNNAALAAAIEAVAPPTSDALRYHRDGWIFQMISWIANQRLTNGNTLASIPHSQPADKGFDSLLIRLTATTPQNIDVVVICEDKATENSRPTITGQVWPDFRICENGERDSELLAETTALLERSGLPNIDALIEDIHWDEKRAYKVSITVEGAEHDDDARRDLFEDYEEVVTGLVAKRSAATFVVDDIRAWMDQFCEQVTEKLTDVE